jgi:lipoprotein-releasing system permease protein
VLGYELADRFFLRVGDPIVLISPLGGPSTPLGPAPRMMKFRVAGIFRANFYQFDEGFAYTDLAGAQKFMKLDDEVSGIEVRTADAYRSEQVAQRVEQQLGEAFYARDWKRFYPGFFEALKNERVMMFVLLSFIMVVAGFIIIATLIMMIMEKSRDIAILKAMGCDDEGVLRIFAIEGVLIGVAGLGSGLAMGLLLTWNLDLIQSVVEMMTGYDPLPPNVYQLRQLPYAIDPGQIALISLIAMVLSIGATLLPSWQAARLDPAEALRYE